MYNVTDYGIVGDNKTLNTEKINTLLKKIGKNGGTVYFPPGNYITGSIVMQSNTTIFIDAGARLIASGDFDEFPYITDNETPGFNTKRHRGFISAFECENIAIIGHGEIIGNGEVWWKLGKSDTERPRTVNFMLCKNVKIKDITVKDSPCWTIHPVCCENVTIDAVTVVNPYNSPNTDGINPESCKNVRISNCHIDVGDDCITIKSGTEDDLLQKQYACENITVTNCTMSHGHGGVVIGSEMSGGIKNVVISNCVFQNTDRGIRIKTRRNRGGSVEGVLIGNIVMYNVKAAITINEFYYCGVPQNSTDLFSPEKMPITHLTPKISNININGIIARNVQAAGIYFYGLPECRISDVTISNTDISVTGCKNGYLAVLAHNRELSYGEGIFMENAEKICMNNVKITCPQKAVTVINCADITLNNKQL